MLPGVDRRNCPLVPVIRSCSCRSADDAGRFAVSIKSEYLNRLVILGEQHLALASAAFRRAESRMVLWSRVRPAEAGEDLPGSQSENTG
jgi:hypothetical protein